MTTGQPSQSIRNLSWDASLVELSSLVKRWFHLLIFHVAVPIRRKHIKTGDGESLAVGIVEDPAASESPWPDEPQGLSQLLNPITLRTSLPP
jgi:hypothetical protein